MPSEAELSPGARGRHIWRDELREEHIEVVLQLPLAPG
jgi:hypothetical protein